MITLAVGWLCTVGLLGWVPVSSDSLSLRWSRVKCYRKFSDWTCNRLESIVSQRGPSLCGGALQDIWHPAPQVINASSTKDNQKGTFIHLFPDTSQGLVLPCLKTIGVYYQDS